MRFLYAALLCLAACTPRLPAETENPAARAIISVVPSATEMLFAFGVGDRLIAVGDYDQLPADAGDKPRIGGLLNPNIEKIIELNPDLVITYGTQDVLQERLRALGIRIYPFMHGGVDETLQYMMDLGVTVGAEAAARSIVDRIQNSFEDIRENAPARRPRVLLIHNRNVGTLGGFFSVGAAAFQHELIDIAGGVNIFEDVNQEVIQPTIEEIIARAPDIVVETLPSGAPDSEIRQRIADWRLLSKLPAVLENRIHITAEDYMLVPGPRLDSAAREFAEIIQ